MAGAIAIQFPARGTAPRADVNSITAAFADVLRHATSDNLPPPYKLLIRGCNASFYVEAALQEAWGAREPLCRELRANPGSATLKKSLTVTDKAF